MQSVTISNIYIKREMPNFNKYFIVVVDVSNFFNFYITTN